MKRIVVIGTTGSGKTTLARQIAQKTGYPLVDLDELQWRPGWQPAPREEFYADTDSATAGDTWVVSGNYREVRDIVWPRADTLIWLDCGYWRNFWQLFTRSIRRIVKKEPACNGNIETWARFLSRESIMWWFFTTYFRRRRNNTDLFNNPGAYAHVKMLRFRSPQQAAEFVKTTSFS